MVALQFIDAHHVSPVVDEKDFDPVSHASDGGGNKEKIFQYLVGPLNQPSADMHGFTPCRSSYALTRERAD